MPIFKKVESKALSRRRLELVDKGFLIAQEVAEFVPCGKDDAAKIFKEIRENIKKEGLENHTGVILAKRMLAYLDLTEAQIRAGVKNGGQ